MLIIIKHRLLFIAAALLALPLVTRAQFTVSPSNTSFTVSTSAQVETSNILNSPSFALNVNSKTLTYDLRAQVISKTSSTTSTMSADRLQITFLSTTGSSTGYQPGALTLSESTPTALTTLGPPGVAATTNTNRVVSYAMQLRSVGYAIKPGTYTFTIRFTYRDYKANNSLNQTLTQDITVTITVNKVIALALGTNPDQTMTFSSVSSFTNGITINNGTSLTIKSNTTWLVSASSNSDFFGYSGTFASTNMPASLLKVTATGNSQVALSTTASTLITSSAATANSVYDLSFYAKPGYTYGPGTYSLTVTYTLTAL
jgi:hypothetical protein